MPREIKTTLALDGEAKFKAGISAINKEMSVLNSEMKVVTSEYGKNGSSIKGLTEQSKVLSQQIEQQKVKQKALSGAVSDAQAAFDKAAAKAADMAAKFGENSKEAQLAAEAVSRADKTLQEYKIQSNNATAALNKMNDAQKQLKADTLNKLTEGLKKVVSAAGEAAAGMAKVAANSAATAVNATTKALTAYTSAALATGTAAIKLATNSAAAADNIDEESQRLGMSREEFQQWDYVLSQNGVSIDSMSTGMKSMTAAMADLAKGGKKGEETLAKLGVTTRDLSELSQEEIFEKSVVALQNMPESYEKARLAQQLFGKQGQEMLPLLNASKGTITELKEKAKECGMIMNDEAVTSGANFADALETLKRTASGVTNSLSAEMLPGLTNLFGQITEKIPGIADAFSFALAGNNTVLTNKLTEIGKLLTDKFTAVFPSFLAVFNSLILTLVQVVGTALPPAFATILPQLLEGFNSLISGLVVQIPVLLPLVIDGGITLFMGIIDSLNLVIEQLMPLFPDLIAKIGTTLTEQLPIIIEQGFNILIGVVDGITSAIPVLLQKVVTLIPVIIQSLSDGLPKILACGTSLIVELAKGLPIAIPAVIKAIPQINKAIIDAVLNTNWLDVGVQVLKGIAEGLVEGLKSINDVIKEVSDGVVNKFKSFFGIQSPSKLFKNEVGKYLASGLGAGFDDEMKNVSKNMTAAVPTNFDFDVTANTRSRTAGGVAGTTQYGSNIEAGGGQAVALGDTVINVPIYLDSEPLAEKTIRIANDKSISAGRSVIV